MFANTQAGGIDNGFPDVCFTPAPPVPAPVPVPYPNIASGPMGVGAAYNVLFSCAPTHNLGTSIPMTNGDNAGLAGGIASGTDMAQCRPLTVALSICPTTCRRYRQSQKANRQKLNTRCSPVATLSYLTSCTAILVAAIPTQVH